MDLSRSSDEDQTDIIKWRLFFTRDVAKYGLFIVDRQTRVKDVNSPNDVQSEPLIKSNRRIQRNALWRENLFLDFQENQSI